MWINCILWFFYLLYCSLWASCSTIKHLFVCLLTWTDIFFRTCVLWFFHLSLVKTIVKSAKYPVDNMPSLWKTITLFHKNEVPEIIKLAQYALTLPLHTCSCFERVFSNQNLIVTRLRSRLNPKISDRLLRVRTQRQGNNQAWLPKLFKQMKGSKEQNLEKKDIYYSVDLFIKMFVHLFIQAFFITSQTKTSKLRRYIVHVVG
jgi:predicted amidophosphoribosyltransferase